MGIPFRELQARMTSEDFGLYRAFYTFEPWGFRAERFGHAIVASTIANTVPRVNSSSPFTPSDFMPEDPYDGDDA